MVDNTCAASAAPLEGNCAIFVANEIPLDYLSIVVRSMRASSRKGIKVIVFWGTGTEASRPEIVEALKKADVFYDLLYMKSSLFDSFEGGLTAVVEDVKALGLNLLFVGRGV
jgi:hypothetical protein